MFIVAGIGSLQLTLPSIAADDKNPKTSVDEKNTGDLKKGNEKKRRATA
jgi:hypothetical protein